SLRFENRVRGIGDKRVILPQPARSNAGNQVQAERQLERTGEVEVAGVIVGIEVDQASGRTLGLRCASGRLNAVGSAERIIKCQCAGVVRKIGAAITNLDAYSTPGKFAHYPRRVGEVVDRLGTLHAVSTRKRRAWAGIENLAQRPGTGFMFPSVRSLYI